MEIMQHAARETVIHYHHQKITVGETDFVETVLPIILLLEKGEIKKVEFHTHDATLLFEMLKACYDKFIVAAGGLVKNKKGALLLIFRNGKWDLPKGKIEKDETSAEGALREVQEETGLKRLKLLSEFQRTYHTYTQNEKRILKETVWYLMQTDDKVTTPQLEEGITKTEWMAPADSATVFANTYDNILLLLKAFYNSAKEKVA